MTTLKAPRVPEQRDFPSRLHHPAVAARIGAWLGICLFLTFATGETWSTSRLGWPPGWCCTTSSSSR